MAVNVSERIDEVTCQIRNVAEQTNPLALNATVEATRDSAAGKVSAVVTAEVNALASEGKRRYRKTGAYRSFR